MSSNRFRRETWYKNQHLQFSSTLIAYSWCMHSSKVYFEDYLENILDNNQAYTLGDFSVVVLYLQPQFSTLRGRVQLQYWKKLMSQEAIEWERLKIWKLKLQFFESNNNMRMAKAFILDSARQIRLRVMGSYRYHNIICYGII